MPQLPHEVQSRKDNWHASTLETLLGCPRQYWLKYVAGLQEPDKPAPFVGTVFHAAAEWHETHRLAGDKLPTKDQVLAHATELLREGVGGIDPAVLHKETLTVKKELFVGLPALVEQLIACVDHWWSAPVETPEGLLSLRDWLLLMEPVALEHYLTASVIPGSKDLGGTADGLYRRKDSGRLVLVDHKTTGSMSYWKDVGSHIFQAAHYSVLVAMAEEEELGYLPEVVFSVIRKLPAQRKNTKVAALIGYQPTMDDVVMLGQRVRAGEQIVNEGKFLPDPTYQWCRTCTFFNDCQIGERKLAGDVTKLSELMDR